MISKPVFSVCPCSSLAGDDWIATGIYRFKVSQQAGKRTLNKDRLRLELMDALGDEHAAEKLISWCENEGKAFERLAVNAVRNQFLVVRRNWTKLAFKDSFKPIKQTIIP